MYSNQKIEMSKAASGVAIFLILFLLASNEMLAQTSNRSDVQHSLSIIPMNPIESSNIAIAIKNPSTLVKTCDYKKIQAQYAQVLKVKPDDEMTQLTKDQQQQADLAAEKIIQSRQNDIVKSSQQLSAKFNLSELTYADLQNVTPSASNTSVASANITSQPVAANPKSSNNPIISLNNDQGHFSQPLASAEGFVNNDGTSVSIRRTYGLLKNKSKLEQKYILSYKIHENEGD